MKPTLALLPSAQPGYAVVFFKAKFSDREARKTLALLKAAIQREMIRESRIAKTPKK